MGSIKPCLAAISNSFEAINAYFYGNKYICNFRLKSIDKNFSLQIFAIARNFTLNLYRDLGF